MSANESATEVSPKNKTLYVRAEDREVWSKAEAWADEPLSALVAELLRGWVVEREKEAEARYTGMQRIVLEVQEAFGMQRRRVAFKGRLLTTVPGPAGADWTIYITAKGRLAVFDGFQLSDFNDLQDFKAKVPAAHEMAPQIAEALKRGQVEELDI